MSKAPIEVSSVQFGRNVARLRHRVGMTQERLAEATSLSSRYIQQLERGKGTNPSLAVIQRLKMVLQCSWEELFDSGN